MQRVPNQTGLPLLLLTGWWAATLLMWWMAFWSLPSATPEWLVRAQAVCFGVNETGLPESYGWIMLILSPLSFAVALVVAYWRELRESLIRVYFMPLGKGAFLMAVLLTSGEAAWVTQRVQEGMRAATPLTFQSDENLSEDYPRTNHIAPEFFLKDQTGAVGGVQNFTGRPLILTFAFAHCQTMCPAILTEIRKAREKLSPSIPTLVVTLDPWRDTPFSLSGMAEAWELGENAYIYSGDPDKVSQTIRDYNVPVSRDSITGDVTHPPMVYILDAKGRIAYTFNQPVHHWIVDAVARL